MGIRHLSTFVDLDLAHSFMNRAQVSHYLIQCFQPPLIWYPILSAQLSEQNLLVNLLKDLRHNPKTGQANVEEPQQKKIFPSKIIQKVKKQVKMTSGMDSSSFIFWAKEVKSMGKRATSCAWRMQACSSHGGVGEKNA